MTEQHHTVSHHGNDPENIAKVARINTYHVELFAKFLDKMRATPDGDGSLLDHSLIFYGGGMGNPNQHASDPLPLIAVGGGLGRDIATSCFPRARRSAICGWRSRSSTAARSITSATATGRSSCSRSAIQN